MTMPNRDELSRHYGQLPDEQLMRLAIQEADGLTPVAVDVLTEELRKRQLGDDLGAAIEIQTHELKPEEHNQLVQQFRQLPCPSCGSADALLNAAQVATARSFLILTEYDERLVVGCSRCILDAARKANRLTLTFAWWGIPWGPIRGIQALMINGDAYSAAEKEQATEELNQYVAANRGEIMLRLKQHQDLLTAMGT